MHCTYCIHCICSILYINLYYIILYIHCFIMILYMDALRENDFRVLNMYIVCRNEFQCNAMYCSAMSGKVLPSYALLHPLECNVM